MAEQTMDQYDLVTQRRSFQLAGAEAENIKLRMLVEEIERLRAILERIKAHTEWKAGPSDSDEALFAIKLLASYALDTAL
jgi:hypothetical protein